VTEWQYNLALVALAVAISVACNGLGFGRRVIVLILTMCFLTLGMFRGMDMAFAAVDKVLQEIKAQPTKPSRLNV
jgi:hypothetical protein